MKFETDYIEQLAKIVADNDLTEITLEDSEKAIVIKREKTQVQVAAAPVVAQAPVAQSQPEQKSEEKEEAPKGTPITSPMVGTYYSAPSPGAKPFVNVGSTVSAGQVVCIIEAMKLMNEIEAEVSGKVTKICVEDGQAVEYGQTLMYVE